MVNNVGVAIWIALTLPLVTTGSKFVYYTSPLSYATLLDGLQPLPHRTPAQCAVLCAANPRCKLFSVENDTCELLSGRIRIMQIVFSWFSPTKLYVPPEVLEGGRLEMNIQDILTTRPLNSKMSRL